MKRTLLALAIPSMLIANAAHAQSSVTLYGVIDEGFDYLSNVGGHRSYNMVSGETAGSHWGIKGNEDLGGGLSAIFRLENGFNVNTGTLNQDGREFGLQAVAGLASTHYGTFTMGRQYDPTIDMWSSFTASGNTIGDFASHPFDNDNADWDFRANNSIKYVSPLIAGFQGEAMYAFSNATGFANNRLYGFAGTYTMNQFSAALAYMRIDNPAAPVTTAGTSTIGGAVSGDYLFSGNAEQHIDAGMKWTFANQSNVALAYSHTDIYANNGIIDSHVTGDSFTDTNAIKFDNLELNGQYFFSPTVWGAAAYTFTHASQHTLTGDYSSDWNQLSLMLNYVLSKRTSVYVQGAYQRSSKDALGGGANIEGFGYSSNEAQTLVRLGMTHHF